MRGQLTKFTRNNPGDSQSQCKLKPQKTYQYLSLIHRFTFRFPKFLQSWKQEHSPVSRPGHMPSPQRPQPGLLQLSLLLQEKGQVVHGGERVRGVAVPVGTRSLPRLGGAALQPRGSRWSAKVVKHEKSSRSRGFMADLWERVKANEGHTSWTLMRKYYSKHLSKTVGTHRNQL